MSLKYTQLILQIVLIPSWSKIIKMVKWKNLCSSSPARTLKLQLTAEQLSIEECQIPAKNDAPSPRAKEKPQKDSKNGKIVFRIKPYTHQRCLEGSNKTLCAPGHRDLTENEPDLPFSLWVSPAEVWVSSGLPQGQGLWVQQTWATQLVV